MSKKKSNDILYIDTAYRPEAGSFAIPVPKYSYKRIGDSFERIDPDRYKVIQWCTCRDLFHSRLYNLKLFFFSHQTGKGRSVSEFMQKVESILEIKNRSEYGATQRKTIMWIKPSYWWTQRAMRRSLYTILLRAGNGYSPSKDNFEEALFSNFYTTKTQYAVRRFLAGNTIYTGKKKGWYNQFHNIDSNTDLVDLLLVKP
jgi:hypothetical protein